MKLALCLLVCLLLPNISCAAFKSSTDITKPEEAFNPQPSQDDILLPMPCGLYMAMKAVAVPQGTLIRDKTFPMGITNSQDGNRQIYERQFPGYIAAPFTRQDLPAAWKSSLKGGAKSDAWYFIGKYEVSSLQWDAVMNVLDADGQENPNACPQKITPAMTMPVTGISWFQVQEFLNKYNAWLVKNHVSSLPAFSGTQNIAFLRLPTEEEWEYAARGGSHVPPEWWADQDMFPLGEGKTINDYAVTSQESVMPGPLPIGSRLPNPAGLHDTAGNVREMVDGFFRMSISDMRNGQVIRRLHGAAGGILIKGGTYASTKNEFFPGWRDEVPLYTANGPGRPADLGFRVALAGLNVPNAQRLKTLSAEAGKSLDQGQPTKELGKTPLEAIAVLESQADGGLKTNLEKIRALIEAQEEAQAGEDRKILEHNLRSLLYQSETIRAFAFKYLATQEQLEKIRRLLGGDLTSEDRTKAKRVLADGERDLKDYMQTLKMGASYYKTSLENVAEKSPDAIRELIDQIRKEYGASTVFDEHMRTNLENLERFLAISRKKGASSLGTRQILSDILPANHFKRLGI